MGFLKNFKTEKQASRRVVFVALLGLIVVVASLLYQVPYGKTQEEAIHVYLKNVTTHYQILNEQKATGDSGATVRYVVSADCRYSWKGVNQGRKDGKNTYFFDLRQTEKGWQVVGANSGP